MQIKSILRRILKKLHLFEAVYYCTHYSEREYRLHTGGTQNADKTFYIIRTREDGVEGLMSLLIETLKKMEYAEGKGYISYVNWSGGTQYSVADENVWEEYFTQPCQYSLDEIMRSRNVIKSGYFMGTSMLFDGMRTDEIMAQRAYRFMSERFDLTQAVYEQLDREISYVRPEQCLGVYVRGTDYLARRPSGHPVQPEPEQVLEKADEFLKQYNLEAVYLVTEDEGIYEQFEKHYGAKLRLVSYDSFITNYTGTKYLSKSGAVDETNRHQRGMDYLVKILVLSKCDYYVGGITNGSTMAMIFRGKPYVGEYIFELGDYA